ncbi:hypothetical protein I552_0420 [Mycobacterium xenopi 3993]|nr:hypothetical protein I552_0420 [Mycobacterium xenopi 3993]
MHHNAVELEVAPQSVWRVDARDGTLTVSTNGDDNAGMGCPWYVPWPGRCGMPNSTRLISGSRPPTSRPERTQALVTAQRGDRLA